MSGLPVPLFYLLLSDPDWIMSDAELAGVTFIRRATAPTLAPVPRAQAWQSALWILNDALKADPANSEAAAARDRVAALLAAAGG